MNSLSPKKGVNKGGIKNSMNVNDPSTKEFSSKVEKLGKTNFSVLGLNGTAASPGAAFNYLYIHSEHEKKCIRRCFMMEEMQRQALMVVKDPRSLNPDFIKAGIRVMMCCMRLGDTASARDAITLLNKLGEINGISAFCQAIISGTKVQNQSLNKIDQLEKEGMDALKNKEFTKALEILEKALKHANGCLRIQMARGDCLVHLGRYVDGVRAASRILQQDQWDVGALFMRGFCLYRMDDLERAHTHFEQVLQFSPDHARAKTLLGRAKLYMDKKDAATKAMTSGRLEDALNLYTEIGAIDPNNKGTNANTLALKAGVLARMKKFDGSIADCGKALKLDSNCLAGVLQDMYCKKETDSVVQDGAGKLPNDMEKAKVKDSQMDDKNSPKLQKSEDMIKGNLIRLTESNVEDYTIHCMKKTDFVVQDGASKVIPNDVEKAKVKNSQMDDKNSTKPQKSEDMIKGKPRSSTESNVEDYKKICWSCSKTKVEVKLYTCIGCNRAKYCSRECMEHDWPHHKNWCFKQQKKNYKKICWSCSKTKVEVELYTCNGCNRAKYCSRECIEHDWPIHKNWCLKQQTKREVKITGLPLD